jgi:hypothetical protein
MAVEEVKELQQEAIAKAIADLERRLAETFQRSEGSLKKLRTLQTDPQRFDMIFFKDLIVAVAIFAATAVCFIKHVPVIGDPWTLLLGPVLGLVGSLMHRPPRQ